MEQQALVIALVGILGIGAQWLAWRTGWPAIVLMLAAGFFAGPIAGAFGYPLLDPEGAFGDMLEPMVTIGVALILFEGGLSLDFRELRKYGGGVWRLVILGVPLGWLFGSLAGYYVAGLVWPVAILFAGILVVTGPTVVIPLLRQSAVQQRPAALLKWEAIVNDPFGALCAVIAYEYFRRSAEGGTPIEVVPTIAIAALISAVIGYGAAKVIAWSFPRGFVPEFLKVPVLLVAVVAVFVGCNLIEHEAGLLAVTVMGIALANMGVASLRSIHPFKQNIAVLLVSGIFILLSASLDIAQLRQFEWQFGLFVLAILFLVRPATVLLSLAFSDVPWNERLFLAWIAPRGIVLVAISGLFALRMNELGYADGSILIGLSFAVVVATIVAHGFTIDLVARWLGVKGVERPGILIAGATPWTIALAKELHSIDTPVMLVDANWQHIRDARRAGLPTYHGEILNEATEHNLDLAPFRFLIAATDNEAYNALVCSEFAPEIGTDKVYQLGEGEDDDHRALPADLRGRALFTSGFGVDDVLHRQEEGWIFRKTKLSEQFNMEDVEVMLPTAANMLLIVRPSGNLRFFTHANTPEPQAGDTIVSFSPPRKKTAEAAAAKKAGKSGTAKPPSDVNMLRMPVMFGDLPKVALQMAMASALALTLAACEIRDTSGADDTVPEDEPSAAPTSVLAEAEPSPEPSETPVASIIRDDLDGETAPEAPPPPFELILPFPDGADLTPQTERMLESVMTSAALSEGWPVILAGHTDSSGYDQANLRASRARAEAVAAWLVERGVADERITVIAFGEQNPIAPNARPDGTANAEGRRANRRVELRIAPKDTPVVTPTPANTADTKGA